MGEETGCARAQHSRRSDGQKRCCIIFGNVFFLLLNTLIKNENYFFQVLQSKLTIFLLEFSIQCESVGFRFYAKILLKETMYKIMIFRGLKNLKCRCDGRQEGIYFIILSFGSFLLIIILICGVRYSRDRQCL